MASVIPKTMKSGQAALLFIKVGGRSEVLLGKFLGGVAFTAIPALICVTGLYLTMGWRLDIWENRLFLAVPFALLFYSVMAAVTVALGVLTKSSSASLVVTLIFAASVLALQEAAARPVDEEAEDAVTTGTVIASSGGFPVLQTISWIMPRTHDLMEGMDRALGLRTPRPFRDLVRRWRIGKLKVGAAAADVLANESKGPMEVMTPLKLGEAVVITSAFTCLTLVAASVMLNRRDL